MSALSEAGFWLGVPTGMVLMLVALLLVPAAIAQVNLWQGARK